MWNGVIRRVLVAVLLACGAGAARAQVTETLPLTDAAYRHVDRLVAEGLVRQVIVGQRPFTRREMARITREALRLADAAEGGRQTSDGAIEALAALEREFLRAERGGVVVLTRSLRADATWLDGRERALRQDSIGFVDATINPLVSDEGGRRGFDGGAMALESSHTLRLGRHALLVAEPRVVVAHERGRGAHGPSVLAQRLYATAGARNVLLTVGREHVVLGQSEWGGLAASTNPPALGMVRVATDTPFHFPWLLRRLGAARATAFVADLGRGQNFPHARLVGYKLTLTSGTRFEIGSAGLVHTGGRGAPPATLRDRLLDIVPLADVILLPDEDFLFSNKLNGVDVRLRIPEAGGLELYAEGMLDDFDVRRLGSSLWEDNGIVAGVVLPRLGAGGRVRATAELQHTGVRFYKHREFASGITYNRALIGSQLGHQGNAGVLRLRHASRGSNWMELATTVESRGGDHYEAVALDEQEAGFRFVRTIVRPREMRYRVVASMSRALSDPRVRVEARAGYERVTAFDNVAGDDRNGVLARVGVAFRP